MTRLMQRDAELRGYVSHYTAGSIQQIELTRLGLRYVQEEEDQVRWEDALVHALYQLQNRMHLYAGGEEEESPQRVGQAAKHVWRTYANVRVGPSILKDSRID
jgi:hypothetical protein